MTSSALASSGLSEASGQLSHSHLCGLLDREHFTADTAFGDVGKLEGKPLDRVINALMCTVSFAGLILEVARDIFPLHHVALRIGEHGFVGVLSGATLDSQVKLTAIVVLHHGRIIDVASPFVVLRHEVSGDRFAGTLVIHSVSVASTDDTENRRGLRTALDMGGRGLLRIAALDQRFDRGRGHKGNECGTIDTVQLFGKLGGGNVSNGGGCGSVHRRGSIKGGKGDLT